MSKTHKKHPPKNPPTSRFVLDEEDDATMAGYGFTKGPDGVWRDVVSTSAHSAPLATSADASAAIVSASHTVAPSKTHGAHTSHKPIVSCFHRPGKPLFTLDGWIDGAPVILTLTAFGSSGYDLACATCAAVIDLAKPFRPPVPPVTIPPALTGAWSTLLTPTFTPADVITIDWPDYGTPAVRPAFWPALRDALVSTYPDGSMIAVGCVGGHGRTGTALSALYMVSHPNASHTDAIEAVRELHCVKAVESGAQIAYLADVREWLTANPQARMYTGPRLVREEPPTTPKRRVRR